MYFLNDAVNLIPRGSYQQVARCPHGNREKVWIIVNGELRKYAGLGRPGDGGTRSDGWEGRGVRTRGGGAARGESGGVPARWFIWYGIHSNGLQTSPGAARRAERGESSCIDFD